MDVSGKKFALTAEEVAQGISVNSKLEHLCYRFERWDELFGYRQNMAPSSTYE